ncbi:Down syndrome cell adhesion molecule [Trichoplax sp. H2]|nr:Down syndrome cell adhesion molecule [Trichoplax sp. H2]|eukprot:RDD45647.1 Down syndrome cell adhesion molecule [Trichoplax sp. H2]
MQYYKSSFKVISSAVTCLCKFKRFILLLPLNTAAIDIAQDATAKQSYPVIKYRFYLYYLVDIPLTTVTVQSNTTTYYYGIYAALTCKATSLPLAKLSWTKDSVPLINGSNVHIMNSVSSANSTYAQSVIILKGLILVNNGNYKCVGNYKDGGTIIQSTTITLSKLYCKSYEEWHAHQHSVTIMEAVEKLIMVAKFSAGIQCETSLPGVSVLMTCQAVSRPLSKLKWSKNGVEIGNSSNVMVIPQPTLLSNRTLARSVLIINNLMLSNNGEYRCVAHYVSFTLINSPAISIRMGYSVKFCSSQGTCSKIAGSDSLKCSCNFGFTGNHCETQLPHIPLSSVVAQSNVSKFLLGSRIGLKCQAKARPRPKFNWYHNGKQVTPGDRINMYPGDVNSNEDTIMILVIQTLILSDAGAYYCQVTDNISSKSLPVPQNFAIHMANVIKPKLEPYAGSYAKLQCQAVGRPLPSITWTKNNITFVPGNATKISNVVSDTKSKITSYLVFSPLAIGNNGAYSCRVHDSTDSQVQQTPLFDMNFVCSHGYCSNNGQCKMNNNKPSCSRLGGFEGDNCQSPVTRNVGSYIGIAIGCAVGILILVAGYTILRRKGSLQHKTLSFGGFSRAFGRKPAIRNNLLQSYENADDCIYENPSFGTQDKDL